MPAAPRRCPDSYPVKPAACHPFLKEGEVDAARFGGRSLSSAEIECNRILTPYRSKLPLP